MNAQPLRINQDTADRWHNHLPKWIVEDPPYARLRPGVRHTLQAIADRCDAPDERGDLLCCFGGQGLLDLAGVSKATFWRHLTKLESLGYVVTLRRGGQLGDRSFGNMYAVPGRRGSLDHRRAARRMQRMIPNTQGTMTPQIIEPGAQVEIWPNDRIDQHADEVPAKSASAVDSMASVRSEAHQIETGGSLKMRRGASQIETPPSPITISNNHHHGGVSKRGSAGRVRSRRLPKIEDADLKDTQRLLDVFAEAVRRGIVGDSEAGRLRFVAAAEHALHHADVPASMFAWLVNNEKWLHITHQDEDRASRRLHALKNPRPAPVRPEPKPRQKPDLSDDARIVLACRQTIRDAGAAAQRCNPLVFARQLRPDFTMEQWRRGEQELHDRRSR